MSKKLWFEAYFGPAAAKLRPAVVYEGENHAVILLMVEGSMGFVLVKKYGKHGITPHTILHSGQAKQADYERMKAALEKAEA